MAEFIKVDALGDACPLPVVKAKKAISELQGAGQVEVLVIVSGTVWCAP